eukprot:3479391-Pleurochrysis_carterae.AAC.2
MSENVEKEESAREQMRMLVNMPTALPFPFSPGDSLQMLLPVLFTACWPRFVILCAPREHPQSSVLPLPVWSSSLRTCLPTFLPLSYLRLPTCLPTCLQ